MANDVSAVLSSVCQQRLNYIGCSMRTQTFVQYVYNDLLPSGCRSPALLPLLVVVDTESFLSNALESWALKVRNIETLWTTVSTSLSPPR
jgi:hypothetical protein